MRVHLIGVGGVGMAGLAVLLKVRGHEVSGCDLKATSRTDWLERQGIAFSVGHDPSHLSDVDEVIVTPAVDGRNPELQACKVPVRFRGEVLAELVGKSDAIAVCGSHGKTTTATWIAKLLLSLGEDVSWCIGGETGDFPVAGTPETPWMRHPCRVTDKELRGPLVVEADESDGTLALYHARTLVVNKCEYDHPDHFKTEADYFACYETAKRQAGTVIESESLDLGLFDCSDCLDCLSCLAMHNRRNARAAIEVALRRGHSLDAIAKVLPSVVAELPDRRFQRIWPPQPLTSDLGLRTSSVTVVTDYAHHPTEMACAVAMARQRCKGVLRVLFQPHRYSRTKALLKDFPVAFEGADEVVLCPTYAAFEQPVEGGDVADLYWVCRDFNAEDRRIRGCVFYLSRSCDEAWEHARNSMKEGDLTLLLGAGDIVNLVPRVQSDLGSSDSLNLKVFRRIWIGQGSNTWKPDLNLSVEFVRTRGPADKPGSSLGIPWMAGIPGTIGGWIKMNAGAFGHSISEVIDEVKVDGKWISAAACGFSYRHSDIQGEIQDYRLKVKVEGQGQQWNCSAFPVDATSSSRQNEEGSVHSSNSTLHFTSSYYLSRRKKFPSGTYGSFFKNPPGDFAGRLLEAAGAKELRVGGAHVWSEHANVIVRGEGATSSDVLALARLMRNRVLFRFGIALEPEVCGITM